MVLLHYVIQVLILAQPAAAQGAFGVELLDRGRIGGVLDSAILANKKTDASPKAALNFVRCFRRENQCSPRVDEPVLHDENACLGPATISVKRVRVMVYWKAHSNIIPTQVS